MFGPAGVPAQNRAHRTDPTWAKVAPGEYVRSDGAMIRKVARREWSWIAYHPDGSEMAKSPQIAVGGHSLTLAKEAVATYEREAR